MTDKKLKRLSKSELLELLLYVRKELDTLRSENDELKKRLAERNELIERLDEIKSGVDRLGGFSDNSGGAG